jgi:uncharacterized membrane protein YkoI
MKIRFAMGAVMACMLCASLALAAPQAASKQSAPKKAAAPAAVDLSKLPAPVRATIEAETKNATLKHVGKETEKGKVQYEVETMMNGKSHDLLVDPSGKVLEVEDEIAVAAAPAPVQDALKAKGKVLKLETVQKDGATTYEAQVQGKNGKKSSVALDAQGKAIKG